jgi:glycosyltransferase involved in cell wall biosynthesis
MHIAINAQLLSATAGYRKAGIHRYIWGVLSHLPDAAPDAHFTVMLNHHLSTPLPRTDERVSFDTTHPLRRILWEQVIQPGVVRRLQPTLYYSPAFVIPRFLPCPSVVMVHDLSFEHFPEVLSRARRYYLRNFARASCRRATRIIANSQSTARDIALTWNIPREKIDVSLVGVSSEFRPLAPETIAAFREQKQLPSRFLLFLGTLEPRKNLSMLLRAYAALPETVRNDLHLVLAGGKGWMFDDIFATIAACGLEATVHTPGYLASDELPMWYNAADAFVYPALYEGFGIPLLEAMACGKLVLAADTSSLPEALGDTGVLLPPHNEQAWTAAMQSVYDMYPIPQQTDAVARATTFTWRAAAQRTVESFRQALS